jgi:hypothetical protein
VTLRSCSQCPKLQNSPARSPRYSPITTSTEITDNRSPVSLHEEPINHKWLPQSNAIAVGKPSTPRDSESQWQGLGEPSGPAGAMSTTATQDREQNAVYAGLPTIAEDDPQSMPSCSRPTQTPSEMQSMASCS